MRPVPRLLPLPLLIALSLAAHADDDKPVNWSMCPVEDAVPAFADAPVVKAGTVGREDLPTNIDGDETVGVDGGDYSVTGNVTLSRGDQFLAADNLQYSQDTGTYTATGSVRYQDSGLRIVADRIEGNQDNDTHRIDNVRYQLIERRGNGGAERIDMVGSEGSLLQSTYSTCPPSERMWELRARRIDVDLDEGMGVARSATLRVGKVPLLYIPWLAFPIDDRRRTGLLYPSISQSSRNGLDWRQPIYFNLAPNYDLTLTPRLMTQRGLQLGSEFRYLTPRGRGELELQYLPSDDLVERERAREAIEVPIAENRRKSDRAMLRYVARQDIDQRWQARAHLNWVSDPRYIEDASSNIDGISNISLQSEAGFYGRGRDWSAGLVSSYWLLADYTQPESSLPYNRLPRAYLNWDKQLPLGLRASVETEAVRFAHVDSRNRPGGSRFDVKGTLGLPIEGPSWFIRPAMSWRHTQYQLDDDLAQGIAAERARNALGLGAGAVVPPDVLARYYDDSPSRSLPIGSLDAGLFFDRDTSWRGERFLHTLEPRLFYLNAPYRDQSAMPLFDTRPLTFSWGQLFRDNRYSGADRQSDANQLTLALTTRLIRESDGQEKLSASIGQIHYFDESLVTIGNEAPVEQGRSAWVADTSYAINDRWTISAGYQWNPSSRREDLASLRTRYLVGDDGVINFGYRYRRNPVTQRDLLQQVDFSFLYPLNNAWSLVGRYYYSIQDSTMLEGIAGIQWESCCVAARLVARRYVRNRIGEMNDAIQLEIELKGLGSAGPETESRLRRAILGYYRDDLYLVPPSEVRNTPDDASTNFIP